ncbi:MAG TPA: LacI family DNA-binding transcriptional regulator [Chloroflexota bacterium]|nr:LacI family DNA-binding transcriptional regulator [Chloroflexota bacterium]
MARAAGVVDSTVSRVLNGRDAAAGGQSGLRVPPQTRARILAAALALDYRPHHAARALRDGRTGVVAFVLPELDIPSAAALAVDGHRLAAARGYVAQVLPRGDTVAELVSTLRFLGQRPADAAVILAPGQHPQVEQELRALARAVPLLLFSKWPLTLPGAVVGYESMERRAGLAVRHLLALGRRRIAYLGEVPGEGGGTSSAEVYGRELAGVGLAPGKVILCRRGAASRADACAAVTRLLDVRAGQRIDAIFAGTTNTAIGAGFALQRARVAVPQQVALVTLGQSSELEWIYPGISSVVSDSRRPGELLGRLFERLEQVHASGLAHHELAARDPFWSGRPVELPARLVVRASTAGA